MWSPTLNHPLLRHAVFRKKSTSDRIANFDHGVQEAGVSNPHRALEGQASGQAKAVRPPREKGIAGQTYRQKEKWAEGLSRGGHGVRGGCGICQEADQCSDPAEVEPSANNRMAPYLHLKNL